MDVTRADILGTKHALLELHVSVSCKLRCRFCGQEIENAVEVEPEQFLVLFRPGTTSVWSGLQTFFVSEPER